MRAGAGPDRKDAVGNRNAGRDGGVTGTCHVIFCSLHTLLIHFFFSLFFFSGCLKYDNRQDGTGRNGNNADGAATRDGTGGKEGRKGRCKGGLQV